MHQSQIAQYGSFEGTYYFPFFLEHELRHERWRRKLIYAVFPYINVGNSSFHIQMGKSKKRQKFEMSIKNICTVWLWKKEIRTFQRLLQTLNINDLALRFFLFLL